MVSYEEALAIAKKARKGIDRCAECEDCYMFDSKNDGEAIGGFDSPVLIMKSDGHAIGYTFYIQNNGYKQPKVIREFDI